MQFASVDHCQLVQAVAQARVCRVCGRAVPPSPKRASLKPVKCQSCRGGRHYKSKEEQASYVRAYVERRRASGLKAYPGSSAWKKRNRDKVNAYKRRKRSEKGAQTRAAHADPYRSVIERNARDAWRYWISTKASDWWMAQHYEAKPWTNPRLSDADSYRIRYAKDPEFYAREYARLQAKKLRQRSVYQAGEVSADDLHYLRMQNDCCQYCGVFLKLRDRTVDHMLPIARGGLHEVSNLCVCCRSCNSTKRDKTVDEFSLWISMNRKVLPGDRTTRVPRAQFSPSSSAPIASFPWT